MSKPSRRKQQATCKQGWLFSSHPADKQTVNLNSFKKKDSESLFGEIFRGKRNRGYSIVLTWAADKVKGPKKTKKDR